MNILPETQDAFKDAERERCLSVVCCCISSHDGEAERGGRREGSWHCALALETLE